MLKTTKMVDLHCHSSASGGAIGTPSAVAKCLKENGISAYSMTEHDNIDSLEVAILAAEQEELEYLPGIELSVAVDDSDLQELGDTYLHVLAYDFEITLDFLELIKVAKDKSERTYTTLLNRLRQKKIADISIDELREHIKEHFGEDDAWKRPFSPGPIGDLLKIKGAIPEDANSGNATRGFTRELCQDCLHLPDNQLSRVSQVLQESGAVRILAHPYGPTTSASPEQKKRLEIWLERYVDGLELYRYYRNPEYEAMEKAVILNHQCPFTGGSDWHCYPDLNKPNRAPYACLESIREFQQTGKVLDAVLILST